MRWRFFVLVLLLVMAAGPAVAATAVHPFAAEAWSTPANGIDARVLTLLGKKGLEAAPPCSDEVFVRRIYLDLIGTLPRPLEITAFLKDRRPDKRALLIEDLMKRQEFADYWALKWSDLLRVKAEFPINLWPNAVQAYHRWIRQSLRDNLPCDKFARELLTASGSNFRRPPVNFYRAVPGRDPAAIAGTVALTFMGTRFDRWPAERRAGMAAFFSRVAYKKTAEWKEEIVYCDPRPTGVLEAVFPDGVRVRISPEKDPRLLFADWLAAPDNPWFARNMANRAWAWLMGRGIVHEADDIRPDNPPVNPELLDYLEKELRDSHYDMRYLFRLILNSRTYQQSSIPAGKDPRAVEFFACYRVRRLEAEVLSDAIGSICGSGEEYISPIPEPFTVISGNRRAILLEDGSMTSPLLELFGRPSRDTGLESERVNLITAEQQRFLLSASLIQRWIDRSPRLREAVRSAGWRRNEVIRQIYLLILSRYPTLEEEEAAAGYFSREGLTSWNAVDDLAWALINSKEFLYRH